MTTRRNPGCAFGPCNDSKFVGGPGCHLCDDIATLPQRRIGSRAFADEPSDAGQSPMLKSTVDPKPKKKAAAPTTPTRRKGPQTGSLFT